MKKFTDDRKYGRTTPYHKYNTSVKDGRIIITIFINNIDNYLHKNIQRTCTSNIDLNNYKYSACTYIYFSLICNL